MIILMLNTRCSKHVEGTKNWIKALIYKMCISLFNITQYNISCSNIAVDMDMT
jgi:hypothetical protein